MILESKIYKMTSKWYLFDGFFFTMNQHDTCEMPMGVVKKIVLIFSVSSGLWPQFVSLPLEEVCSNLQNETELLNFWNNILF